MFFFFFHTVAERNYTIYQAENFWDTPGKLFYTYVALELFQEFSGAVSFGLHTDRRASISPILQMRKSNA